MQDDLEKSNAGLYKSVSDSEKKAIYDFFDNVILDALVELEKLQDFVATNPEAQVELAKALSKTKEVVSNEPDGKITIG